MLRRGAAGKLARDRCLDHSRAQAISSMRKRR